MRILAFPTSRTHELCMSPGCVSCLILPHVQKHSKVLTTRTNRQTFGSKYCYNPRIYGLPLYTWFIKKTPDKLVKKGPVYSRNRSSDIDNKRARESTHNTSADSSSISSLMESLICSRLPAHGPCYPLVLPITQALRSLDALISWRYSTTLPLSLYPVFLYVLSTFVLLYR